MLDKEQKNIIMSSMILRFGYIFEVVDPVLEQSFVTTLLNVIHLLNLFFPFALLHPRLSPIQSTHCLNLDSDRKKSFKNKGCGIFTLQLKIRYENLPLFGNMETLCQQKSSSLPLLHSIGASIIISHLAFLRVDCSRIKQLYGS